MQDGNVRFRTPQEKIKKKPANKRRGRPKKNGVDVDAKDGIISKRPRAKRKPVRSRETPLALKTCAECGETFDDMQKTLAHWPEKHEGKDIRFRCTEDECKMEAPSQEEFLKHWQDHFPEEGKKQHEMMEGYEVHKTFQSSPSWSFTGFPLRSVTSNIGLWDLAHPSFGSRWTELFCCLNTTINVKAYSFVVAPFAARATLAATCTRATCRRTPTTRTSSVALASSHSSLPRA